MATPFKDYYSYVLGQLEVWLEVHDFDSHIFEPEDDAEWEGRYDEHIMAMAASFYILHPSLVEKTDLDIKDCLQMFSNAALAYGLIDETSVAWIQDEFTNRGRYTMQNWPVNENKLGELYHAGVALAEQIKKYPEYKPGSQRDDTIPKLEYRVLRRLYERARREYPMNHEPADHNRSEV